MLVMTMNEHGERRWITRYVSSEKFDIGTCIEHSPHAIVYTSSPHTKTAPPVLPHCWRA